MRPLLSIVVPTKNRYYYLEFLVKYFNSIDSCKIELIIQDNSDIDTNKNFVEFLKNINDDRISYLYVSEDLTIDKNCDMALKRATGEYITMIGDDDIFSEFLVDFTSIFKDENIEAILPVKGSFTWPDVKPRLYGKKLAGVFKVNEFSFNRKKIDVAKELNRVIELGGTEMLNLPRIYHGIIKKSILEQIFDETGTYFPGPSPDMANAVALCKFVKNYEIIDIPLIISGHSKKSGGGQGAEGQHFGEIAKLKFLPKDTATNWTKEIPFYWSGYTIYGESVVQALKRTGMRKLLDKLNYQYLIASCLVYDTNYKERIYKVLNERTIGFKLKVYFYFLIIWIKRLKFHFNLAFNLFGDKLSGSKYKSTNANDILEVAIFTDKIIQDGNITLKSKTE